MDVPGQWNLITFAGEAGQNVSISPSEASFSGEFRLFRPNGAEIPGSGGLLFSIHGPFTLPETGTYTIRLIGSNEATGSVKATSHGEERTRGFRTVDSYTCTGCRNFRWSRADDGAPLA